MKLPWVTRRDLRERVAELEAEIERAQKIDTAVKLLRAGEQPDRSFMLELHSDLWPLIAQSLYVWFKDSGATNYVEQVVGFEREQAKASMTFKVFDRSFCPEMFTLTLQRQSGHTPHQLRVMAEAKAARLEARLAEIAAQAAP